MLIISVTLAFSTILSPINIKVIRGICSQFSSVTQSCPTLCDPMNHTACQASLSIANSWSSCKLMSIESVMPSSHLILCRPLLLLPPILHSVGVFSNESTPRMRWPKYWSFSFSISPFKEHPGLISFRMDWLDLLAVQEPVLKSYIQYYNLINGKLSYVFLREKNICMVHLDFSWFLYLQIHLPTKMSL